MSDKMQALNEDIAYMRDLAEAGASTPLVSGTVMVVVGALFGVISLAHWTWFQLADPQDWMVVTMWIGAAVVCWTFCYFWVARRMMRKPGVASPSNRAVGWTWNSTGWTVNVLLVASLILSWRLDSTLPFTLFPSVIAGVYGGAWLVTARMSGQNWMMWPTIGSFAFALLLAVLITTSYLWIAFSAAFFLTVMVPGIIMVRGEPRTVV